ncbi:MAG: hypothetical protein L0Z70_10015 [Chloroflexi bacterium]|nr:hypothetical protein [Chloroflexota bacterium]
MENKTLRQYLEEVKLLDIVITPQGEIDITDPHTRQVIEALQSGQLKLPKIPLPDIICPDGGSDGHDLICPNRCPNTNCPCGGETQGDESASGG